MKNILCTKEIELDGLAKEIIEKAGKENHIGAKIIGLYGDLGSGKTTFTKHFARNLGIMDEVTSPTFVIQKRFEIKNPDIKNFKNFYHIDVYRLESPDEIKVLGWNEIVKNPENLILVEWADKIQELIPKYALKIKFLFVNDKTREIQIFE